MPLVSVITPTQARNADHIGSLWRSLSEQVLPDGWEMEWLVQEDGPSPAVGTLLPEDPRIRFDALGVQTGGPATRNHALARARGEVVAGMDHDDLYEPGGLSALLQPFTDPSDRRGLGWSCGRTRLLMEDGTTWTKDDVLPPGRVAAGRVADHFLSTDDFPFPAAVTAYATDVLVAHGGWPAVARSDDAVLLAALGDDWDGWWIDRTVAVYRRWSGQKTVQAQDWAIRDLPHVRGLIGQRRTARRRTVGTISSDAGQGRPAGMSSPIAGP